MAVTNYYTMDGEIVGEKTGAGARVDYLTDALGSVVGTVNQSAQVVNTYRYKPFGGLLAKTGVGNDPAFQWVGNQGYRNTGKKWSDVYVRARHDDTVTGRWTTADRLWPTEPAYIYCNDQPITVVDRSGLRVVKDDQIGIGGIRGADCGLWIGGPCDYARSHNYGDPSVAGTVVCCNGKAYPCALGTGSGNAKCVTECVLEHEHIHLDQVNCPPCGFSIAQFKIPWLPAYFECDAYRASATCLLRRRNDCCANLVLNKAECEAEYKKAMCAVCWELRCLEKSGFCPIDFWRFRSACMGYSFSACGLRDPSLLSDCDKPKIRRNPLVMLTSLS